MSCTPRGGSGDVIFANPTAAVELVPINGSAVTAMRSDAAPRLNEAITPVWTGQHQFNAWPKISGNPPAIEYDDTGSGLTCLAYAGTGSPEGVIAGNVGSTYRDLTGTPGATYYVKESSPTPTTGWVAVSKTTFAAPSGTVQLTAVAGVLSTAMRSDASPPLDQAIAPTWSNIHTWERANNGAWNPIIFQNLNHGLLVSFNFPVQFQDGAGVDRTAYTWEVSKADTWANGATANARVTFNVATSGSLKNVFTGERGNSILGDILSPNLLVGATDGFTYIPAIAGDPVGTPTAYTGKVPMTFDPATGKLWIYDGTNWKFATLT